jgi:glycosyltransferase involved in cell wall biosynthesis
MAGAAMGGAEAFYERLTLALHDAGDAVLPVIRRDPRRAALLAGLAPVQLGFGGAFDFTTTRRLRTALDGFGPDVIVAWMNRAARYCARAWPAPRRAPLVGRLGGYYDLKYYARFDHLVGNTRGIRDWLVAEGWPAERAHMVPNFVEDFVGIAPAILTGPVRLLAMGRLHANKGFSTLLRAMPALPDVHLSLAGEGPERAALEALAGKLGIARRVSFLGWREDRGAMLAGCDIFVCPSHHEPLGNVVLEAFSAARPIVAAAADGPREVIIDGDTGLLVPVADADALAAAIAFLVADPARAARLAGAGRAAFEQHHAEGPVVAEWRTFLARVSKEQR